QDDRALGAFDQLQRGLDLLLFSGRGRAVAGQDDLAFRILELGDGVLHVFGDIDQNWAGPPRARDVERFLDGIGQVFYIVDQVIMLGDGQRDAGDVRLLEGVAA